MNKRAVGDEKERLVQKYLTDNGVLIVEKNYRCRIGEIDLIGYERDGSLAYLVFFEVKYRRNSKKGYAAEAVNIQKQMKISKVADYYRLTKKVKPDMPVRFDVVAIDADSIAWHKNAFSYIGLC